MFEIVIDPIDFKRYIRALRRVERVATREVTSRQQMRSAIDYQHRLTFNIVSQKFGGSYAPYSPRYARWKKKRVRKFPSWWVLSGNLLRSLTQFAINLSVSWLVFQCAYLLKYKLKKLVTCGK